MKPKIKSLIKYIITFILTVILLVIAMTVTNKIPKSLISKNLKQSTKAFSTHLEVDEVVKRRDYTFLHPYADAMLLNIVYCINEEEPLKSALEAKYYTEHLGIEKMDKYVSYNLEELVESQVEGNKEYLRYWHGAMIIVRILLIFLDLSQMYIFNLIILTILSLTLCIMLIRKKAYALTFALCVSFIMCMVITVPFCLEYTWTFYIMLIASIISVKYKDSPKKLNMLYFLTGMLTCFFDFLTTEIITILVPVIIVLVLKIKEEQITGFKQGIKFVVESCFLWGISYSCMWLAKWIIASVVLKINAFDYVSNQVNERIQGEVLGTTAANLPWKAITINIFTLYPLNTEKTISKWIVIPIGILIFEAIFIRKKDLKKLWVSLLMLLIALIPYVRYAIVANHSYCHYFFTFRSQIPTIMCIVLAMIYGIDKNYWKEKINQVQKYIKKE